MSEENQNDEVFGELSDAMNVPPPDLVPVGQETKVDMSEAVQEDKEALELAEIDTPENRALLERVLQKKDNVNTLWWDLSKDLTLVSEKKAYRLQGCKRIEDYFELLDLGSRIGYYLKDTYEYFTNTVAEMYPGQPEKVALIQDTVKGLGSTKTRVIASGKITDPEVFDTLFNDLTQEDGSHKTVSQLRNTVKILKVHAEVDAGEQPKEEVSYEKNRRLVLSLVQGKYGDVEKYLSAKRAADGLEDTNNSKDSLYIYDAVKEAAASMGIALSDEWRTYNFSVKKDESEVIEAALARAKELAAQNPSNKGPYAWILGEWLADSYAARESKTLEQSLEELSKVHNVSIIAIKNDEKGQMFVDENESIVPVFGREHLSTIGMEAE